MASISTFAGLPKPDDPLAKALARIAELEDELRISQQSAKIAREELQYFVYAAGHDLQEPLRTITNYGQLLERLRPEDVQAKEFVAFINSGVSSMRLLIENLLVYARINTAPMLSNVRLNSAIQATLYKLSAAISKCGATCKFDDLPEITAYEPQLSLLFEQIIANSLIFRGPRTPEIEVSAEESEWNGEPAYIVRVKDNGEGIEPQYLLQVVQPFKRLHNKEYPGSGLGLAICEKIMRAHNGKLWLESDGSTGTTVNLAFPI